MTYKEARRTPLWRTIDNLVEAVWYGASSIAFGLASTHPIVERNPPWGDAFAFSFWASAAIASIYAILFVTQALACLLLTACGEARFVITSTPEAQ